MRQKILLIAAVLFGILAFVFTYYQINIEKQRILGSAQDVVLIRLKRAMTEGDKIREADIEAYPAKRFDAALITEIPWRQKDRIIDQELLFSKQQGTLLNWNDLKTSNTMSGKSGLTGIIPQGLRAISISVDSTSSVTCLIQPGNNVDIIGTFRFPDTRADSSLDTITMTILQNVKVLATGNDMKPQNDPRMQTAAKGYTTITLALTPKEVEMIVFASQKGKLTLSLRNYEETRIEEKLQNVNFKFLESHIEDYNKERKEKLIKK